MYNTRKKKKNSRAWSRIFRVREKSKEKIANTHNEKENKCAIAVWEICMLYFSKAKENLT